MKKVNIFDLEYDKEFREKFHRGCEKIFDEAFLTNHTYTKKFEHDFATFNNSKYSLAVSNGTAALEVALRAIDVRAKRVILPSNTFIATAIAVLNAGGIPDIIDVAKPYYSLCPEQLKKVISKDVGAVIVVHIGGHITPQIEEIVNICNESSIPLVEDCAQAHGSTFKNKKCGNFGIAGCYSHFITKVMTTAEGGTVVCNDENFLNTMKSVRQFGMDSTNAISHIRPGSNFKMTEFQALLGCLELERVEQRIARRREIALLYQKQLRDSSWLALEDEQHTVGNYYKQIVIPPIDRNLVSTHFSDNGIALTGGVYNIPLHKQPSIAHFAKHEYPICDKFSAEHICPPCYPELSNEDVEYICNVMLRLQDGSC